MFCPSFYCVALYLAKHVIICVSHKLLQNSRGKKGLIFCAESRHFFFSFGLIHAVNALSPTIRCACFSEKELNFCMSVPLLFPPSIVETE